LILEVHPNPAEALSDGVQSLTPPDFERLMVQLARVAEAVGRQMEPVAPAGPAQVRVRVEAD